MTKKHNEVHHLRTKVLRCTQGAVAKSLGVSTRTVARYEAGDPPERALKAIRLLVICATQRAISRDPAR